jgi:predicted O-linked N-acetylglucosamine transferase (SPINDLY family)
MTIESEIPQAVASSVEQELEKITAIILQLAADHNQTGNITEAEDLYLAVLQAQPQQPEANYKLGLLRMQAQRPVAGLPYFEAALAARPEQEQYWLAYIDALILANQTETARQVLELAWQHGLQGSAADKLALRLEMSFPSPSQPDMPVAVEAPSQPSPPIKIPTKDTGSGKAIKALHKKPGKAPSAKKIDVVMTLLRQGRIAEAETLALALTKLFPQHGFGWKVLGALYGAQGKTEISILAMRNAVYFSPMDAEAHSNLGITLQDQGDFSASEKILLMALKIEPNYAAAHFNLSIALAGQGRFDDTIASLQRALSIKPDSASWHSNLLFYRSQIEGIPASTLFDEHCRFGEQFETPLRTLWMPHGNLRDPERCLQIGFVSGDLYNHAVTSFIEPVLAHLQENKKLSLHAYCNNNINDSVTRRLQGYFSHWHSVSGMSDAAMEKQIRTDGIDILIDLSGHTAYNRLLVFARKPAPIQASWIGYPGTTGLQAIDYFLTDRFLLPCGQFDRQFTEKFAYLPVAAPFISSPDAPPVNLLPALTNGHLTFGSFNRPGKLNQKVIALWAQLLRALPDARMLLAGMEQNDNNATLLGWFAEEGIAHERLSFHPRSGMPAYLALHHQVDVCLDTVPYAGGTTTLHALWMGVPTLTLAGTTAAGRQGAAILGHVGLENLVADDAADFLQKGLLIADNMTYLANLRAGLRERFEQSPMGRPEKIADGLAQALRTMWQRWCAGLETTSFEALPEDRNHPTSGIPT